MAEAKQFVRPAISVILIGGTILGAINVFGDNSEVKAEAEKTACGEADCAVTLTRESRSPLGHDYTFQTDLETQTTVAVTCKREYVLLGAWSCSR